MVPQLRHLELQLSTPGRGVMHKDLKLENIMLASVQPPEVGLGEPQAVAADLWQSILDIRSTGNSSSLRTLAACVHLPCKSS